MKLLASAAADVLHLSPITGSTLKRLTIHAEKVETKLRRDNPAVVVRGAKGFSVMIGDNQEIQVAHCQEDAKWQFPGYADQG